ncbi:PsbP domain-containing protein 6 [Ranunculus cassubicifolius]
MPSGSVDYVLMKLSAKLGHLFQAAYNGNQLIYALIAKGNFEIFSSGNVQPYEFILPPTWKQLRIANILSGNYCQPKCAEPWIEVKFEDVNQGRVQVVASPLIRLTNKTNATIEDIGSPENLITSLGSFVTGNTLDPDEVLETSIEKHGDQTYYTYVLETPLALTGAHNLAKATAKGNTVILFVASASDKQWQTSQKTLKAIVDSFQV